MGQIISNRLGDRLKNGQRQRTMNEILNYWVPQMRAILLGLSTLFLLGYTLRFRHWHSWVARQQVGLYELLECRSCSETRLVRVQDDPAIDKWLHGR